MLLDHEKERAASPLGHRGRRLGGGLEDALGGVLAQRGILLAGGPVLALALRRWVGQDDLSVVTG